MVTRKKNSTTQTKSIEARWLFTQEDMDLASIAKKLALSPSTVSRYKTRDKGTELDWDKTLLQMCAQPKTPITGFSQIVEDLTQFIRQTLAEVKEADNIPPAEKVKMLASLSSSLTRTIAGARKFEPEILLEVVIAELLEIVGQKLTKLDKEAAHAFALSLEGIKHEINKRKRSWQG
ncbi:MAG: DUF1804 family protein [SAR324 cluster bacterium]|nr:DUF1804 family protein [SAR324 cluster bacterium]